MTNTERNTALAALFGEEGYEVATECPQGHEVEECEIGEICPHCDWDTEVVPIPDSYWEASRLCKAAEWMPHWHPEWRIQPAPKDFTVPGVLEPLAEALLSRWSPDLPFSMYRWSHQFFPVGPERGHLVTISIDNMDQSDLECVGEGTGTTYEIALGEALLSAAEGRRLYNVLCKLLTAHYNGGHAFSLGVGRV